MRAPLLLLIVSSAAASASPVPVAVAGVHAPGSAPSLQGALSERIMRGLLAAGATTSGPGDVQRLAGKEGRAALLGCGGTRTCAPSVLEKAGADVVVVGHFEPESSTGWLVAFATTDGSKVADVPIAAANGEWGDAAEAAARRLAPTLYEGAGRSLLPRPPYFAFGTGMMVVGAGLAAGSIWMLFDAAHNYEIVTSRNGTYTTSQALNAAQAGKLEVVIGPVLIPVALGAIAAGTFFYAQASPQVPPSALHVSWALSPGGFAVAGTW